MRVHTTRSDQAYMACLRRPACPACGERQFAATATEFTEERIVHTWVCEDCEHEFRTVIAIPPLAV